jgi:hypothetical protein
MATNQLVVFVIDGERYGVSIDQVQEIIRYTPPRSVSSDDPRVRGVITCAAASSRYSTWHPTWVSRRATAPAETS